MRVRQMKTLTVQNTLIHYSVQLKTYQVISMGYIHVWYIWSNAKKWRSCTKPTCITL